MNLKYQITVQKPDHRYGKIKKQSSECSVVEYASAVEYLADGKEHELVQLLRLL